MPTITISGLGKREIVKYDTPNITLFQLRDLFCTQAKLQDPSTVMFT